MVWIEIVHLHKHCWNQWWYEYQEVVTLVQAKQDEHVASLDIIDLKDCFKTVVLK